MDESTSERNKKKNLSEKISADELNVTTINTVSHVPHRLLQCRVSLLLGEDYTHFQALIDSGANRSLIGEDVLEEFQQSHCIDSTKITSVLTAGKEDLGCCGQVNLSVVIGSYKLDPFHFIVIPKNVKMNHSIILGYDFLKQFRIVVDSERRCLSFPISTDYQQSIDLYLSEGGAPTHCIQQFCCVCAKDTLVPMGQKVSVPIRNLPKIDDHHLLFYDGAMRGVTSQSLVGVPGLVDSNQTYVMLTRFSDAGPKRVREGENLGSIITVHESETPFQVLTAHSADAQELESLCELSHLSEDERALVIEVLLKHADVLSRGDSDIGLVRQTEHKIILQDHTPIYSKPRRLPEPVAAEIDKQCRELLEMDIIEKSASPWSSPIVPIRKPDGTIRLCVDYRHLNQVTKADRFPMPNLLDMVYGLNGMKYFSTIDLVRGYYQMPISPESKELTAFSTP